MVLSSSHKRRSSRAAMAMFFSKNNKKNKLLWPIMKLGHLPVIFHKNYKKAVWDKFDIQKSHRDVHGMQLDTAN
jgi:hypothetical protein